jgi:hypothetical protein
MGAYSVFICHEVSLIWGHPPFLNNPEVIMQIDIPLNEMYTEASIILAPFDETYFRGLDMGVTDHWLPPDIRRYRTVVSSNGVRLGIVGLFPCWESENTSHTVVDAAHRGQGLATLFKHKLMDELGVSEITLVVRLDNTPSIRSVEKLPNVERVSDCHYEKRNSKVKYLYKR